MTDGPRDERGPDPHGLVETSADPSAARVALERISAAWPWAAPRMDDTDLLARVVTVTAASRSLTRTLEADPDGLATLERLDRRPALQPGGIDEVVRWKQREYLRIAARDLLGIDRLETTGALLAALARDVLQACVELTGAEALAVIGMGKLGGSELNYASDVDVVFVGDGPPREVDRAAQRVLELARRCYRVDIDLRPEGRDGALVRSIDSYESYWDRWAEPWEFQALLKARPAAGDGLLGARFFDTAQRWLWNQPFDADALRSMRHLKERAEDEVARRGLGDRDLKLGPGGIRDIEFTAQLLQLVHGHHDSLLRSPTTLEALSELARAGYVTADDAAQLADAYRFLRAAEHRLQLVDDQQVHALPTDDVAFAHLARVMAFRSTPQQDASQQLRERVRLEQVTVRTIQQRIYFRPLLEAFAGVDGALSPEAAEDRLAAFGFTDTERTHLAVRELTRGLNRTSRLMQQMLPLMLDWLSSSPDPDLGLLMLLNLLTGPQRQGPILEAFRESPDVARRLCHVLGTSRLIGESLARNPDLVQRLPYEDRLRTQRRDDLVESATKATAWRTDADERQLALRRWKERHLVGIATRDLVFGEPIATVGRDLTALAEATLELALAGGDAEVGRAEVGLAVVALGRFGGAELSYGSDLDVVFVFDGDGSDAFEHADRMAKALLRAVNGGSPSDRIYELDAKLRPEGNQGPLARSLDGYEQYFERWAEVWERQAYLRARVVAGDVDLGRRFLEMLEPFVWDAPFGPAEEREVRRMKSRMEVERIPTGVDPRFHLKLGPGSLSDIEWTAQLLQLRHGLRAPGTLAALRALEAAGHLDTDDADVLTSTYAFLELVRNRLFLVQSAATDQVPTQPEPLRWLARSMDSNAADLRERYRRETRRARRVVERVFYGRI